MHDGSVETLEAAVEVEIYYRGIEAGRPLVLTPQEKADIVEFLKALSSPLVQRTAVPMAPVECP
jgi:cytochrome c peroxidase